MVIAEPEGELSKAPLVRVAKLANNHKMQPVGGCKLDGTGYNTWYNVITKANDTEVNFKVFPKCVSLSLYR